MSYEKELIKGATPSAALTKYIMYESNHICELGSAFQNTVLAPWATPQMVSWSKDASKQVLGECVHSKGKLFPFDASDVVMLERVVMLNRLAKVTKSVVLYAWPMASNPCVAPPCGRTWLEEMLYTLLMRSMVVLPFKSLVWSLLEDLADLAEDQMEV